jgi:hypothetical protein
MFRAVSPFLNFPEVEIDAIGCGEGDPAAKALVTVASAQRDEEDRADTNDLIIFDSSRNLGI